MRNQSLILLAAVVVAGAGCGGSGGSYGSGPSNNNPGGSTSKQVTVRNNVFDPSATTVPAGSTVTWTWAAGADVHNVTFDDGQKSADQSSGGYTRVFGTAGSYPYHCTRHPGMTGSVTVQ